MKQNLAILLAMLVIISTAFAQTASVASEADQFKIYEKNRASFMDRENALKCEACAKDYYSSDKLVGKKPKIDDKYFSDPSHISQSPEAAQKYFSNKESVKRAVTSGSKGADAYFSDESKYQSMSTEQINAASEYFTGKNNLGKDPAATKAYFSKAHGLEVDVLPGQTGLSYNRNAGTLTNQGETLLLKGIPSGTSIKVLPSAGFDIAGNQISGFKNVAFGSTAKESTTWKVDDMTASLPAGGSILRDRGRIEMSSNVVLGTKHGSVRNMDAEMLRVYLDDTKIDGMLDPAVHLGPGGFLANSHASAFFEKDGFKAIAARGDLSIAPGSKGIPKNIQVAAYNKEGKLLKLDSSTVVAENAVSKLRSKPIKASTDGEVTGTGDTVRKAQKALKNLGLGKDKVVKGKTVKFDDGKYGKDTTSAIREFQLREGIYKEGDVGLGSLDAQTMESLMAKSGESAQVDLAGLYRSSYSNEAQLPRVRLPAESGSTAFGTLRQASNGFTPDLNKIGNWGGHLVSSPPSGKKVDGIVTYYYTPVWDPNDKSGVSEPNVGEFDTASSPGHEGNGLRYNPETAQWEHRNWKGTYSDLTEQRRYGQTASGSTMLIGTVAASPDWPFGTRAYVQTRGGSWLELKVNNRGGAIQEEGHIDIWTGVGRNSYENRGGLTGDLAIPSKPKIIFVRPGA